MSMAAIATCSLTSGWTNAVADYNTAGSYTGDTIGTGWAPQAYWPQWWDHHHHYYHYTPYIQPITSCVTVRVMLKFSEVDLLRKAAQRNKKLKAVLEKLTPCIEVVVDLEE